MHTLLINLYNREAVWKNELMGWASNADPLTALHEKLKFETKEEAIKFCVAQGPASSPNVNSEPSPRNTILAMKQFLSQLVLIDALSPLRILTCAGIEFAVEEPANPHDEIGDQDYADNFLSVSFARRYEFYVLQEGTNSVLEIFGWF